MIVAGLLGCGSSNDSGTDGAVTGRGGSSGGGGAAGNSAGGTFTTSVNSDTKLTSLTAAQATQLCNDFNGYAQHTLVPDTCKLDGLLGAAFTSGTSDAELQAACTAAYNACLTSDAGVTSTCTATAVMSEPAACTATVGDLTTCFNDTAAVYNQIPSCSTLTAASLTTALSADAGSSSSPPSCAMFDTGGACTNPATSTGN